MLPETHKVFAYGSNMNLGDLKPWLESRNYPPNQILKAIPARLPGYRLAWNYWSAKRQGGAANVEKSPNDEVLGAILEIGVPLLDALDAKEGHPNRYSRFPHPIECYELENGAPHLAWVYEVTEKFRCEEDKLPTQSYLGIVVEGAKALGLPADYVQQLKSVLPSDL